jgi:hypothetical protein
MRHFLIRLAAAAFVVGLAIGFGPASAAPLPTLNGLASQASPVENVHYYGYRSRGYGGYHPYHYWRPYYRPPYYRPHYYGYSYRPYYRNYGYWNHRRW